MQNDTGDRNRSLGQKNRDGWDVGAVRGDCRGVPVGGRSGSHFGDCRLYRIPQRWMEGRQAGTRRGGNYLVDRRRLGVSFGDSILSILRIAGSAAP